MKKVSQTFLLLSALLVVAATTSGQGPSNATERPTPYIIANPRPVIIPIGQTSGTVTLEWNGGKDHPYAEVWVRVDQNDETFIVEQGRGSRQATVEVGKNYVFKLSDAKVLLASVSVTAKQAAANVQPQPPPAGLPSPRTYSVSGTIRWKKDMGIVPMGPGNSRAAIHPCDPFSVVATDPGSGKAIVYTDQVASPFQMSEEGDYYVCRYTLNAPTGRALYMIATMGGILLLPQESRSPIYIKDPWIGGSRSKPPAGAERGFTGYTSLKLDITRPRAVVNFELLYVPIDRGPK